jgi:hypothetical protein
VNDLVDRVPEAQQLGAVQCGTPTDVGVAWRPFCPEHRPGRSRLFASKRLGDLLQKQGYAVIDDRRNCSRLESGRRLSPATAYQFLMMGREKVVEHFATIRKSDLGVCALPHTPHCAYGANEYPDFSAFA